MNELEKKWLDLCSDFIVNIDNINANLTIEEKVKLLPWYEGMLKMRALAENISSTQGD